VLFVNIIRVKDSFYALSAGEQAKIAAATRAYMAKYAQMGKFKNAYSSIDLKKWIVIWEADSGEEAARIFAQNPNANYVDYDNIPIIEQASYLKIMKEAMEATGKS
jgi:hypothetical protein